MNDYKIGDRVRITLDTTVTQPWDGETIEVATGNIVELEREGVSIERIAVALPTTPGSVIRCDDTGDTYMRTVTGWTNQFGDDLQEFNPLDHGHTILFDAAGIA